eukprot:UC4_evm1s219
MLAVLRGVDNDGRCTMVPSFPVLEFPMYKTTYLKFLADNGAGVLPSVFVQRSDFDDCNADVDVFTAAIFDRIAAELDRNWGCSPRLTLDNCRLFCKSNNQWCRQGQQVIKLPGTPSSKEYRLALMKELKEIVDIQFVKAGSTGVQIQPSVAALCGDSAEYRGYFINGKFTTLTATSFRVSAEDRAALASGSAVESNLTYETFVSDLGVPDPDKVYQGVRFEKIRSSMENIHHLIVKMLHGAAPPFMRVDCAVDGPSQNVLCVEIESGYDSSFFWRQIHTVPIHHMATDMMARDIYGAIENGMEIKK